MKKIILALLTLALFSGCIQYSDGFRKGVLIKFSKKGMFNKTWEGQMNLGGVVSDGNGGMTPNIWEFSVADEKLVPVILEAFESQKPIKLSYNEEFIVAPWRAHSNYFITKIE